MERYAGFYALFTVMAVIGVVVARSFDDDGNFTVGGTWKPEPKAAIIDPSADGDLLIRPGAGGAYFTDVNVDGADVTVLVDTGASFLTLRESDAHDAGIIVRSRDFTTRFSTANGVVMAARAEADYVDLGPARVEKVTVLVLPDDRLEVSLLGMNVLRRFGRVSFDSTGLTIEVE